MRILVYAVIFIVLCSCKKEPEQVEFSAPTGKWNIGSINQTDYNFETSGICSIGGGCWKKGAEEHFTMDSLEFIEFYEDLSWRYFGNTAIDQQGRNCTGGIWVDYELFHKDWSYPINVFHSEDTSRFNYGGFFSYRGMSQLEIWYYTHTDYENGERIKMTIHCWK
ncbi:hypothetical protein ACFLTA_05730 [Bacteroidota bacterium]